LQDAAGDGQTKARAARLPVPGGLSAVERGEQMRQVMGGNACSRIGDLKD
jgi:hypothetical protein